VVTKDISIPYGALTPSLSSGNRLTGACRFTQYFESVMESDLAFADVSEQRGKIIPRSKRLTARLYMWFSRGRGTQRMRFSKIR